jgi:lipopolysaccharide export system permease protein
VTFDRYAFDLSKFSTGPQNSVYTVREKFLWELLWPRPDDALYVAQPDQYRSELSDRIAAPLYPLTFIILACAFLGPPQTTRQSRTLAMLGMIGVVAALRLVGFVSVVVGVRVPGVLSVQFIALFGCMAAGIWQISRGRAIEPANVVSKIATAIGERISRATA